MATLLHSVECPGKRREILCGKVVLGSSGAISSNNCEGFTIVKTSTKTGRYTLTLLKPYNSIDYLHASVELSADTAAVSAKGVVAACRNVSASGKTAQIQLTIVPTAIAAGADAEAEDSAVLRIMVVARRGSL
jgi:hypothetical protein